MNREINLEILLYLRPDRVLRRLGYGKYRPAPNPIDNRLKGLLVESRALIEPKIAYADADIIKHGADFVVLEEQLYLPGSRIARLLINCPQATVFAATVGDEIEAEIATRWRSNRDDEALIIDAIASEAAEELARTAHRWTLVRAKRNRMAVTTRYSPGYGDFPLSVQPQILEYVDAKRIGLSANEALMLVPRKSVTGIIGLYPKT